MRYGVDRSKRLGHIVVFGLFRWIHYTVLVALSDKRLRNPNIMWPWWHEIMRKKEKGEIPMEMPGYMLAS